MEDTLELIVDRCHKIKNTRTPQSILEHAMLEVDELETQTFATLMSVAHGQEPTPHPDGVLGEAIDVLLCAIDYEVMANGMTAEAIQLKIIQKLDKWERLYGNT